VVVLGRTGRNFAAGMSGGMAYVLDEVRATSPRTAATGNGGLEQVVDADAEELKPWCAALREPPATGSTKARVLRQWADVLPQFVKIMPTDYKKALERMAREQEAEAAPPGEMEIALDVVAKQE
jgi:glutamate synthase (NADPH/NADH) large chain